jgi:hypothetical protein
MRRDRDVMERLAAADPAPDAERLSREEQREAEALLARLLATPVGPAADRTRPRFPGVRRRTLLVALGSAFAAVAGVAAIGLLETSAPGDGGIVEKAIAAVTREDAVHHVLGRTRATGSGFDEGGQTVYFESWHTTGGRIHAKAFAANGMRRGRLVAEEAGKRRRDRTSGPALRYDPRENTVYPSAFGRAPDADAVPDIDPFADPGVRLRELEREGRLRLEDTTSVGGRRAYRLVSDSATRWRGFTFDRVEYLVDADTYLPLAQRVLARVESDRTTYELSTRYLTYERVPLDSRSRAELDLDPHPDATCATGAGDISGRGLGFPNPCRSDMENRSGAP